MRTKIGCLLVICLIAMLFMSAAFADTTCSYSFTSQGKTYYAVHDVKNSYYTVSNPLRNTHIDFTNSSLEYRIYEDDAFKAWRQHLAVCPYAHNLGDVRVPMPLLYSSAALAVVAILIVHKKRKSFRAVN